MKLPRIFLRTRWHLFTLCLSVSCLPVTSTAGEILPSGEVREIHSDLHIKARVEINRSTTLHGNLLNGSHGDIRILGGTSQVTGQTVNNGRMEILHSNITFIDGLVTNAALLFDPSTITVTTLTVGPTGFLAETGGPGDRFIITEDFINQSTRNTDWQTSNTIFQFNGGASHNIGNPQTLEAAGADLGNFTAAWQDNFVLGTLEVGPSDTYLMLLDDFDNSATCLNALCEISTVEAVYVNDLTLEAGATLDLAGMNLYVRNTFINNGGTIVNGSITVGDIPTIAGDISGDGTLDGADLLLAHQHIQGQIILTMPQLARGDIYPPVGDGLFTLSDLVVLTDLIL